ncbi:MAG: cobalt ECF transporter T component CbiQ [Rhodobacteraceae bacterium]|nr:cobalt ECF transporter T component CbiQ [Paracoccaceae bacterium]
MADITSAPKTHAPAQPDPRARLVMALMLAFAFSAVGNALLLPVLGAVALAVLARSGMGARQVAVRLRAAGVLAFGIVLVLPLMAGTQVLFQLGPLRWHAEGLAAGLLIAARLLAIVTVTLALLAPLPPYQLVAGARALGVPALMADLALLTLRYVDELRAELSRALLARRLRGGKGGGRGLPDYGVILAAVLIRSHRRAENLWAAMRLRGYGAGGAPVLTPFGARDIRGMGLAAATGIALVLADRAL